MYIYIYIFAHQFTHHYGRCENCILTKAESILAIDWKCSAVYVYVCLYQNISTLTDGGSNFILFYPVKENAVTWKMGDGRDGGKRPSQNAKSSDKTEQWMCKRNGMEWNEINMDTATSHMSFKSMPGTHVCVCVSHKDTHKYHSGINARSNSTLFIR